MTTTQKPIRSIVFAPFVNLDSPVSRPAQLVSVLSELGSVEVITANFDHQTKQYRNNEHLNSSVAIHFLPTLAYSNNASIRRLVSHALLGIEAAIFFLSRRKDYDVIYSTLPLNLLTWLIFVISPKKSKRIADIVDIWPDVLPFSARMRSLFAPFFWLWKALLVDVVRRSDILLAVSDSFLHETKNHFQGLPDNCRRFYIGHPSLTNQSCEKEPVLTLCYVGNIGRLYDFDTLVGALSTPDIREHVQLYVIGSGDRVTWLLDELRHRAIRHQYFGVVYDLEKLSSILARAHLGFNGYVNTTAAFSYKATTYFSAGLPIINSMPDDLEQLVTNRKLGFNYSAGSVDSLVGVLRNCEPDRLTLMSANVEGFAKSELEIYHLRAQIHSFLEMRVRQ